jgi:CubicO group peptidase (beta-lactamase class C family)
LSYSNAAAQLLSYILETVYNKPYKELLQQFILQPAKMKSTGFYESLDQKNIASGYNKNGVLMPYNQSKAAGGLFSTSKTF